MNLQIKTTGSTGWWLTASIERLGIKHKCLGPNLIEISHTDAEALQAASRSIPAGWKRRSGAAARADRLITEALGVLS